MGFFVRRIEHHPDIKILFKDMIGDNDKYLYVCIPFYKK